MKASKNKHTVSSGGQSGGLNHTKDFFESVRRLQPRASKSNYLESKADNYESNPACLFSQLANI